VDGLAEAYVGVAVVQLVGRGGHNKEGGIERLPLIRSDVDAQAGLSRIPGDHRLQRVVREVDRDEDRVDFDCHSRRLPPSIEFVQ